MITHQRQRTLIYPPRTTPISKDAQCGVSRSTSSDSSTDSDGTSTTGGEMGAKGLLSEPEFKDKTAPPPPPPRTLYLRSGYQITEHTLNYLQTIHSLRSDDPLLITNTFKVKGKYNEIPFCDGAAKIRDLPNAGGSSAHSEILSFEMLNCLLNVKLRATEMELEYYPLGSKITDYSVDIPITKEHQIAIGVSVTRAMKFAGEFDDADAEKLLRKKLMGVNESSKAVLKKFRWTKQILHIWAEHSYISDIVTRIYHTLPADLTSNTIVMITTCERAPWVFYEEADS